MSTISRKQATATCETYKHIGEVRRNIDVVIHKLLDRATNHDKSKLESPEVEIFGENTEQLSQVAYGTPEYDECKARVQVAIDHHYANNSHHPEFHKDGINGMNLLDIIEMLCDWKAATKRNKNGNIRKSIEVNAARFGIDPQLVAILENTVKEIFPD